MVRAPEVAVTKLPSADAMVTEASETCPVAANPPTDNLMVDEAARVLPSPSLVSAVKVRTLVLPAGTMKVLPNENEVSSSVPAPTASVAASVKLPSSVASESKSVVVLIWEPSNSSLPLLRFC